MSHRQRLLRPALTVAFLLLSAPTLLAPIYVQQGTDHLLLSTPTNPHQQTVTLPMPVSLATPTVPTVPFQTPIVTSKSSATAVTSISISATMSPTLAATSPTTRAPTSTIVLNPPPTPALAALCARSLSLLLDFATLSYRQKPSPALLAVLTQAAMQREVALAQAWPSLLLIAENFRRLPWGTPNRPELTLAWQSTRQMCQNPRAPKLSVVAVPRPD